MLDRIDADLKDAMLSGEKTKVETLRGLKNALQNEVINSGDKDKSLTEEQIQKVLAREAKKRVEAADIYKQGGNQERAQAELDEKSIIEEYLPERASEEDVAKEVGEAISKIDNPSMADIGQVISEVRAKLGAGADGATIARLTKDRLEQK